MWLALSLATTTFWTPTNIENLLRQGAMIAILAMGETFVIITAGHRSVGRRHRRLFQPDGRVDARCGLPDLAFGRCSRSCIGTGIGMFHAFGIVQMGLPPFIMTLATMQSLRGIGLLITNGATISITNDTFTDFSQGEPVRPCRTCS